MVLGKNVWVRTKASQKFWKNLLQLTILTYVQIVGRPRMKQGIILVATSSASRCIVTAKGRILEPQTPMIPISKIWIMTILRVERTADCSHVVMSGSIFTTHRLVRDPSEPIRKIVRPNTGTCIPLYTRTRNANAQLKYSQR